MNKKLLKRITLILVMMSGVSSVVAEELTAYVDESKSFLEIKDVNRQAEAWAMCAASYDVMAEILSEARPAYSQQLKELANGAQLAVTMSVLSDGIVNSEITPERFNALWTMAQLASTELPKTKQTILAVDAESMGKNGIQKFIGKLARTVEICVGNLEAQQMYIDTWRELAKSGLLKLPEN